MGVCGCGRANGGGDGPGCKWRAEREVVPYGGEEASRACAGEAVIDGCPVQLSPGFEVLPQTALGPFGHDASGAFGGVQLWNAVDQGYSPSCFERAFFGSSHPHCEECNEFEHAISWPDIWTERVERVKELTQIRVRHVWIRRTRPFAWVA